MQSHFHTQPPDWQLWIEDWVLATLRKANYPCGKSNFKPSMLNVQESISFATALNHADIPGY